jgi:phosphatidylserine decarboxylase
MSVSLLDTIKKVILVPPHPAGIPFIGGAAFLTLLFYAISIEFLGFISLILTLFCIYFFRDPDRITPQKSSLVISPADGEISGIVHDLSLPSELGGGDDGRYTRISIFLSVFDVHVNRNPVSGRVIRKVYSPGKFLNADLDKASEDNERCSMIVETTTGTKVCYVQIAGLVARRIINELKEEQTVSAGARFGMIRFGSRLDVYIPEGISPLVCLGQRAICGETILADLEGDEPQRDGKVVG